MAGFQETANISTPPLEVLKLLTLQRDNDALEAIEMYWKREEQGVVEGDDQLHVVKARLRSIVYFINPAFKRILEKKDYDTLKNSLDEMNDIKDAEKVFLQIQDVLDKLQLTKLDMRQQYDRSNPLEEDAVKGL